MVILRHSSLSVRFIGMMEHPPQNSALDDDPALALVHETLPHE